MCNSGKIRISVVWVQYLRYPQNWPFVRAFEALIFHFFIVAFFTELPSLLFHSSREERGPGKEKWQKTHTHPGSRCEYPSAFPALLAVFICTLVCGSFLSSLSLTSLFPGEPLCFWPSVGLEGVWVVLGGFSAPGGLGSSRGMRSNSKSLVFHSSWAMSNTSYSSRPQCAVVSGTNRGLGRSWDDFPISLRL